MGQQNVIKIKSLKLGFLFSDVQPPTIDFCRSPPIFLADPGGGAISAAHDIEWDEPIFHDNDRKAPEIHKSRGFGTFPLGRTMVEYRARDKTGNEARCQIEIEVQENFCSAAPPPSPLNGHRNCTENPDQVFCSLSCSEGYGFALNPEEDYFCNKYAGSPIQDGDEDNSRIWYPKTNPFPFPDCSVVSHSKMIMTPAVISFGILEKKRKRKNDPEDKWRDFEQEEEEEEEEDICNDMFFLRQVRDFFSSFEQGPVSPPTIDGVSDHPSFFIYPADPRGIT